MVLLKLLHVSGSADEQDIVLSDSELQDFVRVGLITKNEDHYYFLSKYKITHPEIDVENVKYSDLQTTVPDSIASIKTQGRFGKLRIVENPTKDFYFDGEYLIYEHSRVVEVNGYSCTKKEGGDNFLFLANVYGIVPKTTSKTYRFPKFEESSVSFDGYDAYYPEIKRDRLIFRGKESEIVWSHVSYNSKSNNLRLSIPGSNMIITYINGESFDPKSVQQKYGLVVRDV